MSFKTILILIVFIACFIAGYFISEMFNNPDIIVRTEYRDVDSTAIILQARKGYILYNQRELIKKFGSIYKDTNIVYMDSVIYRDSIRYTDAKIPVEYIEADTVLTFSKNTLKDSLEVILGLKQRAYWYPIYAFEDSIVLKKVSYIPPAVVLPQTTVWDKAKWALIGAGGIEVLRIIGNLVR